MTEKRKLTIYYDEEGRVCSTAAGKVVLDGAEAFDCVPVTEHNFPCGITHEASMCDVQVIDTDGTIYKGAEGVLRILRESRFGKSNCIY